MNIVWIVIDNVINFVLFGPRLIDKNAGIVSLYIEASAAVFILKIKEYFNIGQGI